MYVPTPTYWTNPPPPFLPGSRHAPVPGWGANPAVAGPARVGIGQAVTMPSVVSGGIKPVTTPLYEALMQQEWAEEPEEKPMSWWPFAIGGVLVVGGAAALIYKYVR